MSVRQPQVPVPEKTYKAGQVLFKENDSSAEMYVIKSGRVEVYIERMGKEIPLGTLERGDVLGEMALFDNRPRSASARVVEDVQAIVITREMFDKRLENVPDWLITIIRILIYRLREADRKIGDNVLRDEIFNTAIVMSFILGRGQSPSGYGHTGELKQQIAEVFELPETAFTHILDKLRLKGMIKIEQGAIAEVKHQLLRDYLKFLKGAIEAEQRIDVEMSDGAYEFLNMLLWLASRQGRRREEKTVIPIDFLHSDTEKMLREFVDNKTIDELVRLNLIEVEQDAASFGRRMDITIDANRIKKVVEFKKMVRLFAWHY